MFTLRYRIMAFFALTTLSTIVIALPYLSIH